MTQDMRHLEHLPAVALADVSVLRAKEATYRGSWKAAGGRSAWFMFRRNMDRLLNMMAAPVDDFGFSMIDFREALVGKDDADDVAMARCVLDYLGRSWEQEDIFRKIEADPSGADGTVLACLRDLRRYAILVEAEMIARGYVEVEGDSSGVLVREPTPDPDPLERAAITYYVWKIPGDRSEDEKLALVDRVVANRPGGGVFGRIAECVGVPEEDVRADVLPHAYRRSGDPTVSTAFIDRHATLARAISHAINFHSLDARLNCPDHVIADLLAPEVALYLDGRSSVQEYEQAAARKLPPAVVASVIADDPLEGGNWSTDLYYLLTSITETLKHRSHFRVRVQRVGNPAEEAWLGIARGPGDSGVSTHLAGAGEVELTHDGLARSILAWWAPPVPAAATSGMVVVDDPWSRDLDALLEALHGVISNLGTRSRAVVKVLPAEGRVTSRVEQLDAYADGTARMFALRGRVYELNGMDLSQTVGAWDKTSFVVSVPPVASRPLDPTEGQS